MRSANVCSVAGNACEGDPAVPPAEDLPRTATSEKLATSTREIGAPLDPELLSERYRGPMAYVVLSGPFHGPPDSIVGPFESIEEADKYAQAQGGNVGHHRFAAVMPLDSPDSN